MVEARGFHSLISMKEQVLQNIGAVINALNQVSTKGEENLSNLGGSISMLRKVYDQINGNLVDQQAEKDK